MRLFYYIFLASFVLALEWLAGVVMLSPEGPNDFAASIIFLPLALISGLGTLFLRLVLRWKGTAVKGKTTILVTGGVLLFGIVYALFDYWNPLYSWFGIQL
jgi:hypothetical protein